MLEYHTCKKKPPLKISGCTPIINQLVVRPRTVFVLCGAGLYIFADAMHSWNPYVFLRNHLTIIPYIRVLCKIFLGDQFTVKPWSESGKQAIV